MKGILFKEDMFFAVIQKLKTQTRRIAISDKPRYTIGEKVFLKEPYIILYNEVHYKFDNGFIGDGKGWQNKMFMPEKYARHYIEIIDVRREPLQDISEDDCIAEGIERVSMPHPYENKNMEGFKNYIFPEMIADAKLSYESLWADINGFDSWVANPNVWVYEFKLVK